MPTLPDTITSPSDIPPAFVHAISRVWAKKLAPSHWDFLRHWLYVNSPCHATSQESPFISSGSGGHGRGGDGELAG